MQVKWKQEPKHSRSFWVSNEVRFSRTFFRYFFHYLIQEIQDGWTPINLHFYSYCYYSQELSPLENLPLPKIFQRHIAVVDNFCPSHAAGIFVDLFTWLVLTQLYNYGSRHVANEHTFSCKRTVMWLYIGNNGIMNCLFHFSGWCTISHDFTPFFFWTGNPSNGQVFILLSLSPSIVIVFFHATFGYLQ